MTVYLVLLIKHNQLSNNNSTTVTPGEKMNNINYDSNSESDRLMVVLTHIGGIFFGFAPSLLVYLVKNEGWVKENARNALNWQLTSLIYYGISWVLVLVIIGLFLPWLIVILNVVFCLVAAIRSSKGEEYKYPLTIEFIKY
ncbi:MAG: DUF4870 domain-containing protein [Methylococcaceae bacterium]